MGDTVLNTTVTVKEKDLGLTISADMKQCEIAAAKENQILGLIR